MPTRNNQQNTHITEDTVYTVEINGTTYKYIFSNPTYVGEYGSGCLYRGTATYWEAKQESSWEARQDTPSKLVHYTVTNREISNTRRIIENEIRAAVE